MNEPSAREQLETLTQQLTNANAEGESMTSQLGAIRTQYDNATQTIRQLESDNESLQSQIDEITRKAANTLAIDRQNQELQQKLTDAEIRVNVLEQEKDQLAGQSNRNWFITGSLVLLGGSTAILRRARIIWRMRSFVEALWGCSP